MRWRIALLSTLVLGATVLVGPVGSASAGPSPDPAASAQEQPVQYRVTGAKSREDRSRIAATGAAVDLVEHGTIYVTATTAEVRSIRRLGFTVDRLPPAPSARAGGAAGFPPADSGYHDYAETVAELDRIADAYPDLARKSVVGKSYEGRDIVALKISDNVGTDEDEPEVLFNANIHAREHLTTEQALYLADLFTSRHGSDTRVTNVVDSREIWIIPMLNPDGSEYDHATGSYRSWRKNRQPNAGTSSVGTDLNRNFGYKWGCCNGSSGSPSSDTYRGSDPFSATETRVLRDFVLSRRIGGEQQIKTHIDLHTYSELILWPFGYTYSDTDQGMTADQEATFRTIGQQMAATNGYTPQQSSDLYITDGDSIDWMWGDQGIWSYVFEMYPASAYPGFYPPDEVIPEQTARNKESVLTLAEYADCPYRAIGKQEQYCADAPAQDFSVSVDPSAGSTDPGGSATVSVGTATTAGEAQRVSLTAGGLPEGATASFEPESLTSGESSRLTVTTTAGTPPGTYPVTVTAAGEHVTRSTTYTLTVRGSVPQGCEDAETVKSGSLTSGSSAYQPDGGYFRTTVSGRFEACLDGPDNADYDLYLQKWSGAGWTTVARGTTPAADEKLTYTGGAGYYRYRVHAYSGNGAYTLGYDTP
ncbi:hypothetical protein GCM10010348_71190 [Streptomyces anthocyanicus]|uniref:M14 family metallopeptidase n=1 Tax=Streptomyces TaxID=1883 RepID=UPI0012919966|nr:MULTISPECIES: M14 family metallopeptidase [Streptomyces]QFX86833.1 zinc carboxypeptidase [Streptomyces sp. SYP-A7193]GHC33938.1 hypothetical protein GCM10010348_71190 [Streptomyces anthocyanicus]